VTLGYRRGCWARISDKTLGAKFLKALLSSSITSRQLPSQIPVQNLVYSETYTIIKCPVVTRDDVSIGNGIYWTLMLVNAEHMKSSTPSLTVAW
jgi:hypothetical protein